MRIYEARTQGGEKRHLTVNRVETLCGHVAKATGPIGDVTARQRWVEATNDRMARTPRHELCTNCVIAQHNLVSAERLVEELKRGSGREHERIEENRAVCAARMAHLARRMLDLPDVSIEDVRQAPLTFRHRLKAKAYGKRESEVTPPSDRTWAVMLRLLEQPQPI